MGRLVTGTLSVDPAAAATKRQIRDLETAYRRQSRSLDRAARKGNLAAGSERIRLIQDAMNRGVDATRFGSSEQRGAARDSMAQNLYGEARDMAQSGMASSELRNQDLNARMDDFVRSNGGNVGGYTPAARAEYDGLRREAMSLAGGFRRASSLGTQGTDSTAQVSLPRKPGQLPKGTAPDLTTTDQQLKPDKNATSDPANESGTHATLTELQKGIDAGAKNAAQEAAKKADAFDPAQAKAKRQADVQKLLDRSKQLLIEHSKPSMTDDSGQGKFGLDQIERSMRQSAQARGADAPSKFMDRPQELGGREGYVATLLGKNAYERVAQMNKDGLSPIEQQLVEGRMKRYERNTEFGPNAAFDQQLSNSVFGAPTPASTPTRMAMPSATSSIVIPAPSQDNSRAEQALANIEALQFRPRITAPPNVAPQVTPTPISPQALQFDPNQNWARQGAAMGAQAISQAWPGIVDTAATAAAMVPALIPRGEEARTMGGQRARFTPQRDMNITQPPSRSDVAEEILRKLTAWPDPKDPKGRVDRGRKMPVGW